MGYWILNQATRLSVKLTTAERLVLVMLAQDMEDSSATGTPSVDYLAGVCALSVRTVKKALLRLESLGLLERRVGCGRAVGPKKQRTTLYVWNEALAAENSLSNQGVIRRGMATRSPAEQRARYGCLVSEMDDASTPSVLADPDPDGARVSSKVSRAVAEPAMVEAPAEPSQPAGVSPEPLEVASAPPQKPRKAPEEAAVSNPLFVEFKAVYGRVKPAEGAAVEKAWLRVVQDRDPREMRAKAERLLEKTRDYVEVRMREKDPVSRVKFTKSPVNFLSDGFWEAVQAPPPAPAMPELGKPIIHGWQRASLSDEGASPAGGAVAAQASVPGGKSFEERHALYAAAAAGDERAVGKLLRQLPVRGFEAPDGVPARWPGLIGVLGLRLPFYASEEDRAAFAAHGSAAGGQAVAEEAVEDSAADFERLMSGDSLAYGGQDPKEVALPAAEVSGGPVIWSEPSPAGASGGSSVAPVEPAGGNGGDWPVEAVGDPSEAYSEAVESAWEPVVAPPAPEPMGSPDDVPVVDDEYGIAVGEAAARVAPYAPLGSAEEFRDKATMLANHEIRHRHGGGVEGQEELF